MSAAPFRKAAKAYDGSVFADCLIPLPAGKKSPPRKKRTGTKGRTSAKTVRKDAREHPNGNVGLRTPAWLVGLDVDGADHGEGKPGPATIAAFEAQHGALPPSIYSTRHGADSATRIRWYAIPEGVVLRERLLRDDPAVHGGVEIVQHHHRFGVVWPSRLADGTRYEWFDGTGQRIRVPQREQIARLPDAWIDALRDDRERQAEHRASSDEVADWIASLHDGDPSPGVLTLIEQIDDTEVGNSTLLSQAGPLVRAITGTRGGRAGLDAFVERVRPAYIAKYDARKFDADLDRALSRAIGDLQAETLTHTFAIPDSGEKSRTTRKKPKKAAPATKKNAARRREHKAKGKHKAAGKLRHNEYTPTGKAGILPSPSLPYDVTDEMVQQQVLPPVVYWLGRWHVYQDGHWIRADDDQVRGLFISALKGAVYLKPVKDTKSGKTTMEEVPWPGNGGAIKNMCDRLQERHSLPADTRTPTWLDGRGGATYLIPMQNGLLDPRTRELHPRSDKFFSLQYLDVKWKPDTPRPQRWLQFLDEIFGADDRKSKRLLQEWMGYLLTGDARRHKGMLILGPKRSGKGTIIAVSQALTGGLAAGVMELSTRSFRNDFGLEGLESSPLITMSDLHASGRDSVDAAQVLLGVIGGDTVSVNRKGRAIVTVRPRARVMVAANHTPSFYDDADVVQSRFLILRTVHSFYQREDHDLLGELLAELDGIAAWALDGYERLQRRGNFTVPANDEQDRAAFSERSAPLTAFIRDVCESTDDRARWTPSTEAWAAYRLWMRVNDEPTVHSFKNGMSDLGFPQIRLRSADGARKIVYRGIALREDALAELRGQDDSTARKKATILWGADPIVTSHQ